MLAKLNLPRTPKSAKKLNQKTESFLIKTKKRRINVKAIEAKMNVMGKAKYYDIVGTAYRNYYFHKIRKLYPRVTRSGKLKVLNPPHLKHASSVTLAKVREDYRKPVRYPTGPRQGKGYKPPFPFQLIGKKFDNDSPRTCHPLYFPLFGPNGEYEGFFHSGGYYAKHGDALIAISMWHPYLFSYRMLRVDGQCSGVPTPDGLIRSSSPMERHRMHDQIARPIPARPPVPASHPTKVKDAIPNLSKGLSSAEKYMKPEEAGPYNKLHFFRYRYDSRPFEGKGRKINDYIKKLNNLKGGKKKDYAEKLATYRPKHEAYIMKQLD